MCLAETEGGERLKHLPDLLDQLTGVAAAHRTWEEPEPGLGHPLDVPERATGLIGLRQGASGELRDHLDHLLVEHHDAAGLLEDRAEVLVEVGSRLPALLGVEVGRDHVALDRAWPEQRDVGDDVPERLEPGLADQLTLTRGFDLET